MESLIGERQASPAKPVSMNERPKLMDASVTTNEAQSVTHAPSKSSIPTADGDSSMTNQDNDSEAVITQPLVIQTRQMTNRSTDEQPIEKEEKRRKKKRKKRPKLVILQLYIN